MQTNIYFQRPSHLVWLTAFTVSILMLLAAPTRPAHAACGGATEVADPMELTNAINAFNSVPTGPCSFTIQLTDNIPLTASTPFIFNSATDVELVIQGQNFAIDGQGIFNVRPFNISNAAVTMENLTVTGGNVGIQGSGINNNGGALTLMRSTVRENEGGFAALNNFGGVVTLIESEISNNTTAGLQSSGSGAEVTLQQSVIRNNSGASAGGINNFGIATLIESTVEENTGSTGGIFNTGGSAQMTLQRSAVINNTTTTFAGGITNSSGTVTLTNSTVSGNTGGIGGIQTTGSLTLNNSTITNNSATNPWLQPAGVLVQLGGNLTLANSLIADQQAGADCAAEGALTSAITSNGYNLDSDGTCLDPTVAGVGDLPSGNANLATLANNGGPTATHLPQSGSDAIDAIPTTVASTHRPSAAAIDAPSESSALHAVCAGTGLAIDQRSVPRPQNGGCDIGSVESDTPLAVTIGWFLAEATGERVIFRWQTLTERGTAGFRLLAADEQGKRLLHEELIPSPAIDSLTPTNYEHTAVTTADLFYLEEVEISGAVTEHGPYERGREYGAFTALPQERTPSAIWLPIVTR